MFMMSGDQCRAKARAAIEQAWRAPDRPTEAEWEAMARAWCELGDVADYQDSIQHRWLTANPD